jgi:meiotically up-regulated gene 157 (Mug157) protein
MATTTAAAAAAPGDVAEQWIGNLIKETVPVVAFDPQLHALVQRNRIHTMMTLLKAQVKDINEQVAKLEDTIEIYSLCFPILVRQILLKNNLGHNPHNMKFVDITRAYIDRYFLAEYRTRRLFLLQILTNIYGACKECVLVSSLPVIKK